MENNIRIFVAIKINPEQKLIAQFHEFKQLFKDEQINWVQEENFHLTLRFLGEIAQHKITGLTIGLQEIASQFHSFEFQISGTGYFGTKGNPRVLFANIGFPNEMKQLANEVEKTVVSRGFYEELKPFRPHLTLGRIKHLENRSRFIRILDEMPQQHYQSVQVSEFVLYQSILRPEGPVYQPIKTFVLL